MTKYLFLAFIITAFVACNDFSKKEETHQKPLKGLQLMILGVAQDAGYPQAGCQKACCELYKNGKERQRHATSLAIIDYDNNKKWLFEATPDIKKQLYSLQEATPKMNMLPNGVFLTHAHIGHYTGLMHFGREAMGTNNLPVFTMPKMKNYLTNQGPWSQLVALNNINLQPLQADSSIQLSDSLSVTPFRVPHRDEYSETVGYQIKTSNKTVLFIPDIDKWQKWEKDIIEVIQSVDLALIDVGLPDGSGVDLLRVIQRSQAPTLCVITTMMSDDATVVAALSAGADGYLLKENPASVLTRQLTQLAIGIPALSPSIARRIMEHFRNTGPAAAIEHDLTARESDVLALIARGLRNAEVADELGLAQSTVAGYIKAIYRKLGISSRAEATWHATQMGLNLKTPQ